MEEGALVLVWVLLAIPLWWVQFRERKLGNFTPRTRRLTWAWIAGLVIILALVR
jgi:hypothetical protein